MPRYAHDPADVLTGSDVKRIYDAAKDRTVQAVISLLWVTGARPSEILELTTDNVTVEPGFLSFVLPTKKLQSDGTTFIMKSRQLRVVRPSNPVNGYLETIALYMERLRPGELLFQYTRRWMEKAINKASQQALHKQLSPYHFRHSAMTREAAAGRTLDQLKHYKGAKTLKSVEPYVHAQPYDVTFGPVQMVPQTCTTCGRLAPALFNNGECETCRSISMAHSLERSLEPYLPRKEEPAKPQEKE